MEEKNIARKKHALSNEVCYMYNGMIWHDTINSHKLLNVASGHKYDLQKLNYYSLTIILHNINKLFMSTVKCK